MDCLPFFGDAVWVTQAGPGGTAGGLQWGSVVDGERVYTANAISDLVPWALPDGNVVVDGLWTAIDARTGEIVWQASPSEGGSTSGPVTTANGRSCLSGAAISNGSIYWGSGYSNFGFGTPNDELYAFSVPD